MRTKHITTKTTFPSDKLGISNIEKDNLEWGKRALRSYRIKVKVSNSQEEMTEFIHFTAEISKLREDKKLTVDKDDSSTHPSFIIHYPKYDTDGSYFIIKCYTVFVDL